MSQQRIRQLKLYQKLQKDLKYREKLEKKLIQISSTSHSDHQSNPLKLNNNKKYLRQELRNLQIQRENRILFDKIQSQSLPSVNKKSKKTSRTLDTQEVQYSHHNLKKRLIKNRTAQESIEKSRLTLQNSEIKLRNKRTITQNQDDIFTSKQELQVHHQNSRFEDVPSVQTILFQGISVIDGIKFKIKIFIKNRIYYLIGKNKHTDILLKMTLSQYRKFHRQTLQSNPSNIFNYLTISKGQIQFKTIEQPRQLITTQNIQQQQSENSSLYKKYKQLKKGNPKHEKHNYQHSANEYEKADIKQRILQKLSVPRTRPLKGRQQDALDDFEPSNKLADRKENLASLVNKQHKNVLGKSQNPEFDATRPRNLSSKELNKQYLKSINKMEESHSMPKYSVHEYEENQFINPALIEEAKKVNKYKLPYL